MPKAKTMKTIGPMRLAYLMKVSRGYICAQAERGQIVGAFKHPVTGKWCFPLPVLFRRSF